MNKKKIIGYIQKISITTVIAIVVFITGKNTLPEIKQLFFDKQKVLFSKENKNYKILVLPFRNFHNNNDLEIGSLLTNTLREIKLREDLNLDILYYDNKISPNFTQDSARFWNNYHNSNLLIYGEYILTQPSDTLINIMFKYVSDEHIPEKLWSNELSYFNKNTLLSMREGKINGSLDDIVYFSLGMYYLKQSKYDNAIEFFEKIENKSIAYHYIGITHMYLKDLKKAIEYCRKSLIFNNDDINVMRTLGLAYFYNRNFQKSIKIYEEALKIDSNDITKLNLSISLYYSGRKDDALEIIDKLIKKDSNNYHALYSKACILDKNKQYKEAEDLLNKVLIIDPQNIKAIHNRACLKLETNRINEAIVDFKICTNIDPENLQSYMNLGNVYFIQLNDYKLAVKYLSKALEISPNNISVNFCLAQAYVYANNFDEALKLYKNVLKLNPDHETVYIGIAFLYKQLGDYEKAKEAIETGLKRNPDNEEGLLLKLLIYYEDGVKDSVSVAWDSYFEKVEQLQASDSLMLK